MLGQVILFLLILPLVENSVYLYNTEDSSAVEFYDCLTDNSLRYCRRPSEPIALQRNQTNLGCYHNGTSHSFTSLVRNNISVSIVLHQWQSSIEKVEEYSRYIKQRQLDNPISGDGKYLCECKHPQSFGKNCEYLLPMGTTFQETLNWEVMMKTENRWQMQLYGDIVCYMTLICDSGLLCLDWRDICDGLQQCMSGYDEENCDKLEFNECEDDEYRCANGMCIPQEYLLDGDYDCLDLTDEKQVFDDTMCAFRQVSFECDDRYCFRYQWSCGDGQCIGDRLNFLTEPPNMDSQCNSLREQHHMCETNSFMSQWTLPNGKCMPFSINEEFITENRSALDGCLYFVKCALSQGTAENCYCKFNFSCQNQSQNPCTSPTIRYPNGGILAPYAFSWYNTTRDWFQRSPDRIEINATIKCRGYVINEDAWLSLRRLLSHRQFEWLMCASERNSAALIKTGYDEFCHNESRTFNNRSYHFIDVCKESKECISAYRIGDGYSDCVFSEDESQDALILETCSNIQHHRFRCSSEQPTCLLAITLGDYSVSCWNLYDELWMGTQTQLSNLVCNSHSKDDCKFIRQYVEASGKIDAKNSSYGQLNEIKIPFRTYCDTFWNLNSREDEDAMCEKWWTCREDQWQCRTGQCIEGIWVLDGEWDCADASDEEGLFASENALSDRNLNVINIDVLKEKFASLYNNQPFGEICNLTVEYPCFRVNVSDPLDIKNNRPCIGLHQIGDGSVDCAGGLDERNNLSLCGLPFMLGYEFKCPSGRKCINYSSHCPDKCENSRVQCYGYNRTSSCSNTTDFMCLNGTCAESGWCDGTHDCSDGEDEYMCIRGANSLSVLGGDLYREKKELYIKTMKQWLQLSEFPINTDKINEPDEIITIEPIGPIGPIGPIEPIGPIGPIGPIEPIEPIGQMISSVPYWCNRGVGIALYNESIVCFCPPQYYGDKCQFHSDRLTVLFHLNLSQSIYVQPNNVDKVLKVLVIFLHDDQPLMTQDFHVRPRDETIVYTKHIYHLIYSRSSQLLQHKRDRYFNRSNIINEHPYSVRIEAYELTLKKQAELVAVWLYPIYFDFLPSFRLAKVLRLNTLKTTDNPCQSNPCGPHRECHQVLNQNSSHICLCRNDFKGKDCSVLDNMCKDGFCSPDALCKPNYRGLLSENERPYCICPLDKIGHRCDIEHDKCYPNPCQNDGTCFPTSDPDQFFCLCDNQYYGKECELEKRAVKLTINESLEHRAAVVQYFNIDFSSFDLILVHQRHYTRLLHFLHYLHIRETSPEIIIVKLYSNTQIEIHLISVQLDVESINGTTQVNERNRCPRVETLFATEAEISLFKYHHLCKANVSLLCFTDKSYLCICDQNHSRVECFGYDHLLDQCSDCLAGGQCIKANQLRTYFICLCPRCYSGRRCEFNSQSFSFTLDQLFSSNLASTRRAEKQTTIFLLIFGSWFLFLLGFLNNIFSFVTFRRSKCRQIGIGHYWLCMSVVNQINLFLLALRSTHLTLNITNFRSDPLLDMVLCKILSYLLIASSRIPYWLVSLIAIERVYITLFLSGQWLKKPHIAKRLIVIMFIFILTMGSYELHFVQSHADSNNGNGAVCVLNFSHQHQIWPRIHQIVTAINTLVPFIINFCCTITISCVVTKKKMNVNARTVYSVATHTNQLETTGQQEHGPNNDSEDEEITQSSPVKQKTRFALLRDVLIENKELIVGPAFTLIPQLFSLPLFVVSVVFACQDIETSSLRYLLIVLYLTSFIPQLTSFFLYISPSSFYTKEWRATDLSKWLQGLKRFHRQVPPSTTIMSSTMKDMNKLEITESK